MKPKTSRGIAVAAIVVILAVTFVSCVTLPRNDAHGPEADVLGRRPWYPVRTMPSR